MRIEFPKAGEPIFIRVTSGEVAPDGGPLTAGDGYPVGGPTLTNPDTLGPNVTVFDASDLDWSTFALRPLTDDDFELVDDPDGDGQVPALKIWSSPD